MAGCNYVSLSARDRQASPGTSLSLSGPLNTTQGGAARTAWSHGTENGKVPFKEITFPFTVEHSGETGGDVLAGASP